MASRYTSNERPPSPGPIPLKTPHSPPPSYTNPHQHGIYEHYNQAPSTHFHTHQGDRKEGPYPRPSGYPPGHYPASNFDQSDHVHNQQLAKPDIRYYENSSNTSSTSGTRSGTHTETVFVTTDGSGRRRKRRREKDVAAGCCAGCLGACCCCAACTVM